MSDTYHGELRWLIRDNDAPYDGHQPLKVKVLQQAFIPRWGGDDGPAEWRDVPTVDESTSSVRFGPKSGEPE